MNEEKLYSEMTNEPDPTILARQQLLGSFKDPQYRHAFLKEHVRTSTALQIRALRDCQGMTQEALGNALGMAQPWVSQLENPDYGKMSVGTLLRLAEAFDVSLDIRFEPFSRLLTRLPRTSREYFEVPNFSEEGLMEKADIETQPVPAQISAMLAKWLSGINQIVAEQLEKSVSSWPQPISTGAGSGPRKVLELVPKQPPGVTNRVGNPSTVGYTQTPVGALG